MNGIGEPLVAAWRRVVDAFFRSFDSTKWFTLGFCAWLFSLLFALPLPPIPWSAAYTLVKDGSLSLDAITSWVTAYGGVPLIIGLVAFLVLCFVYLWLGSRGQFMLLDNLVQARVLVRRPWREFAERANSFYRFRLTWGSAGLVVLLVFVLIGVAYFYFGLNAGYGGFFYLMGVLLCLVLAAISLVVFLVLFLIDDLGPLWLYRHGGTAWDAARQILSLASRHLPVFALYLAVRLLLSLVVSSVGGILSTVTCGVAGWPYFASTVTLPLAALKIWYAIEFFARFGPEYDLRPAPPPLAVEPPPP